VRRRAAASGPGRRDRRGRGARRPHRRGRGLVRRRRPPPLGAARPGGTPGTDARARRAAPVADGT